MLAQGEEESNEILVVAFAVAIRFFVVAVLRHIHFFDDALYFVSRLNVAVFFLNDDNFFLRVVVLLAIAVTVMAGFHVAVG